MQLTIKTPLRFRPSFTLIELLVAIAIIGIMAGMVMFSLAGARTDARIVRTNGTIQKINDVILQRWEEYRYRAVKLNVPPDWLLPRADLAGQPLLNPREGARLRMIALRDLIRMEMPDRYTDLWYPPTRYLVRLNDPVNTNAYGYTDATGFGRAVPPEYDQLRKYFGYKPLGSVTYTTTIGPNRTLIGKEPSLANEQAELLYAIVALSTFQGGSALESFRPSEIADTDNDGYFEFVDAWGQPIRWLRWPAGYTGPLNATYSIQDDNGIPHSPDAMDPARTDWRWGDGIVQKGISTPMPPKPWTLVPLIVSAGPDGLFDIVFDPGTNANPPLPQVFYAGAAFKFPPAPPGYSSAAYFNVDPFLEISPGVVFSSDPAGSSNQVAVYVGSRFDDPIDVGDDPQNTNSGVGQDNWSDNITSHALLLE